MKTRGIDDNDFCIEWYGKPNAKGYAQTYLNGKAIYPHRLVNQTPKGKVTDHLCENRMCIRYDHLETVSSVENVWRGNYMNCHWRTENRPVG